MVVLGVYIGVLMARNTLKNVSKQCKYRKGRNLGHTHFWALRLGHKFLFFDFELI